MSNPVPASPTIGFAPLAWLSRHWRLFSILGALLLTYTLLGFLWVPYLVKKYAIEYVRDTLHRELTLGQVQFNPFALSLQLMQVQLSENNGDPIGRFNYLLVNAEISSLFTGSYNFKKIQLNGPSVRMIVDAQGKLNLNFAEFDSPDQSKANAPLPAVRIGELQLNNGQIHLEDHSRPTAFSTDFAPIQFTLKDFRTQPNYGNAFHFDGSSEAGEKFDWQGDFTVQPLGSTGRLQIADLKASTLQSYLQDTLPFRLLAGSISMQGDYRVAIGENLDLRLNLANVDVKAAQVAPKQGDNTAWVSLSTMQLAGTQVSLPQRTVDIQKLRIDGAQLNTWFDKDYNLNLLELLGPDEPNDQPWTSTVKSIELVDANVQVEDRSIMPVGQFKLYPVQLQVQNFSTAPNTTINLDTRMMINERADFSAVGAVNLDTFSSQLKIKLSNFALQDAQNYAAASTDVLIDTGALNAEGNVYYKGKASTKNPELKFAGNVDIVNLATRDKAEGKDFIKWRSLQLKNMSYSMRPDVLEVDEIIARQPYGRVIIDSDGSTNIQHVLRIKPKQKTEQTEETKPQSKPTAKPTVEQPAAPTMRTRIAKIVIDNGAANFTDNTVQPIFSTGMQRLNGTVTGLSSANNTHAQVKLDGAVDNYAPVSISGEANFLAADTYSDISMNFRNMELTTFNPYSGKFAGYSIAKGKLATDIRYRIRDRKLDAQHHIVIDQLEFGAATDSKDAVPLPVKLAVSLLKDRNGVIDLNLPVSGSIDDPQFKVGPIIWKAFVGLLTKIVTAPFSALGSLFGGGEELAYVDFKPGSAALDPVEASKLNTLTKALIERPQLKLNVPLTVVTDADAAAMNEAAFVQALNSVLPNSANANATQRLAALTTLYQRMLNSAPSFPASPDATDITAGHIAYLEGALKPLYAIKAADRDVLTRARADAVQAALLANPELSAERIYLTARSNEVKSPDGVVRMELKLE